MNLPVLIACRKHRIYVWRVTPSQVVDLSGKEVEREEVFQRLKLETPVLVSVSGGMVEPYYLQVAKPETLIIILGPRERALLPRLLAAARKNPESKANLKKQER